MITPLVRIGALRLGTEFETAHTKRRGCVLERIANSPGIMIQFEDTGLTEILHSHVKVRPLHQLN